MNYILAAIVNIVLGLALELKHVIETDLTRVS